MKSIVSYINEHLTGYDELAAIVSEITTSVSYNNAVKIITDYFADCDKQLTNSQLKKLFNNSTPKTIKRCTRNGEDVDDVDELISYLADKGYYEGPGDGKFSFEANTSDPSDVRRDICIDRVNVKENGTNFTLIIICAEEGSSDATEVLIF